LRPSGESGAMETIVEVRDNGIGVPEEMRPRLFERFFRAHEASQKGIGGTGLGLSIVSETVAAMGGRAWAEFSGEETAFCFSLPTRRLDDEERLKATSPRPANVSAGQTAEDSTR
jgi:signal transduction histidine kinase